jgi:hypothetical protein
MKKMVFTGMALALTAALILPSATFAAGPRVRVVHASPDAPAVDVLVNGAAAFTNAAFKDITAYAPLAAGSYQVQVVPTGATEPVVISATLALEAPNDYTVVAVGKLADIEPLVLVDNNAIPAEGKAHVRFVHASPDAPAVDIAVKGGPVLFSNVSFKGVGDYLPVDAGTYDLEVRLAGTDTVALPVNGLKLDSQTVYTVFAMGLASGTPSLTAVPSVDAQPAPHTLPTTGAAVGSLWVLAMAAGLLLASGTGLKLATTRARRNQ